MVAFVPELDFIDGPGVGGFFLDRTLGVLLENLLHQFLPHGDVQLLYHFLVFHLGEVVDLGFAG